MITVSVVSHGHGEMVTRLISQLIKCPEITKIIVTKNIPEELLLPASSKIQIIINKSPKGFGENHNFVFSCIKTEYFCILNPDIRLQTNPFPRLVEAIKKYKAELIAPKILNECGSTEDSVRYFPTVSLLVKKLFFGISGHYDLIESRNIFSPEWVAGMFMLYKSAAYKKIKGFDNRYFLYYEDVDICVRLWKAEMKIVVDPTVSVIHDARRASRSNFFHMKLHIKSMLLYFFFHFGRLPTIPLSGKHE